MAQQTVNREGIAYLQDAIKQENRVEGLLRQCGTTTPRSRGQLFRLTGDIADSNEEAIEILKRIKRVKNLMSTKIRVYINLNIQLIRRYLL